MSENNENYDAVVVGGGAGGLTAALVLARARLRIAVVDSGAPRNAPADAMHGFLSRDGMSPAALLAEGREELAGYGVDLVEDRVERIDHGFDVRLTSGRTLVARQVVVATGLRDELPAIPGVRERWGRDVLFCPFCHAYEVRDEPFAVLGTQPTSVDHALLLRQWSDDIVFFPCNAELTDDERDRLSAGGVKIAGGKVKRLVVADDQLRGIELEDGQILPRSAVFLAPNMVPHDALLTGLGCATENGWVRVDKSGRTSIPGVWAVGNVVDPRANVVISAGAGAAAAIAVVHDLVVERARG